jgi:phage FluMu gp28-like protein
MSTHRGPNSYFNELIRDIVFNGNPMGWSHHKTTIHQAVDQGIVERINEKTAGHETREEWKARIHKQCGSEEAWNEEYCCIPSDESTSFITHDMITACEDPNLHLLTTDQLIAWLQSPEAPENAELYMGVDIGRKKDLTVFDVGLKVGNITYDKLRLELDRQPFHIQEAELFRLLALPQLKRACIDNTGNGQQMSETAKLTFGYKVEEVHITGPIKEKLAYGLRQAFESLALRLPIDPKLRADIHAMKKIVTATSNIRFDGNTDDSHCDRFIAKALRQEAARPYEDYWALVG